MNNIKQNYLNLVNRIFGRHWYSIKIVYQENNRPIWSNVVEIGLVDKSEILNKRAVKKTCHSVLATKQMNNGTLNVEICAYLGRFKSCPN